MGGALLDGRLASSGDVLSSASVIVDAVQAAIVHEMTFR
jgi:hypothetical protein